MKPRPGPCLIAIAAGWLMTEAGIKMAADVGAPAAPMTASDYREAAANLQSTAASYSAIAAANASRPALFGGDISLAASYREQARQDLAKAAELQQQPAELEQKSVSLSARNSPVSPTFYSAPASTPASYPVGHTVQASQPPASPASAQQLVQSLAKDVQACFSHGPARYQASSSSMVDEMNRTAAETRMGFDRTSDGQPIGYKCSFGVNQLGAKTSANFEASLISPGTRHAGSALSISYQRGSGFDVSMKDLTKPIGAQVISHVDPGTSSFAKAEAAVQSAMNASAHRAAAYNPSHR